MNNKKRHNKILELLEEYDKISLKELVGKLNTSEATIRRDLTLLENKNLLYRIHGGAMKRSSARGSESDVDTKKKEYIFEKREVAKYIAKNIIQSGQTIYLDAGTSTFELIDYLKDKRLTVVTNSSYHLAKLINNKIHTIILGGTVKHSTQAVVGHTALEQLNNYSFDMCFVGCNGIDSSFGITTADESEAYIKACALKNSKKKFILANEDKFGHRKFQKFADLGDVSIISYRVPKEYSVFDNIIEINKEEE